MRAAPALLALALAAAAGCSEPVDAPSLAGRWTGTTLQGLHYWVFGFEATRDPNELAGIVRLHAGASGPFTGTYDHPAVTIAIRMTVDGTEPPVEQPADYHATVNEGMSRMEGTLVFDDRTFHLILNRAQ